MSDEWIPDFERALDTMNDIFAVGYVTPAIAHSRSESAIELSWYITSYRFHEITVVLPRDQFVMAVDRPEYDIKLRAFVRSEWLDSLHLQTYSSFGLVDAINVKQELESGTLSRELVAKLRDRFDEIAADDPETLLISFADSVLLKRHWSVGQYNSQITYTYSPEELLHAIGKVQDAYASILKLDSYAVVTQGANLYYDDELVHISKGHVSLNSLGVPFAQLMAIESTARRAIKAGDHPPFSLYLDRSFFLSVHFNREEFARSGGIQRPYKSPFGSREGEYFAHSLDAALHCIRQR